MKDDTQITHHIWWIVKHYNTQFKGKEYADVINEELNIDLLREIDDLVKHIKVNY